jgi:hypothetical protein
MHKTKKTARLNGVNTNVPINVGDFLRIPRLRMAF